MTQTKRRDLLIYQKYMDLVEHSYGMIRKFPKSEKFSLAAHIKDSMFDTLRYILRANKIYGNTNRRLDLLNTIDAEIQLQKIFVRIAHSNKYISSKQYMNWSKMLDEIGRILGGWIKATRNG